MKINISNLPVCDIPLQSIISDSLTDYSLGLNSEKLVDSIKELGIANPVTLLKVDKPEGLKVICGHRRVHISKSIGSKNIPARIIEEPIDSVTCLKINIIENIYHRNYSDIEKGIIINKVSQTGLSESKIIEEFLPLINIQPSKKLKDDFIKSNQFSGGLKLLLHKNNIPLRVFSVLFPWKDSDRNALEQLIKPLSLGVNKWRDLLELLDETANRENISPAAILEDAEVQGIINDNGVPINNKFDSICHILKLRRFPAITEMQKKFLIALDKLDLDHRTKVRAAKYFENDEIKIELKFSRQKDLLAQVEKLANSAGSDEMGDLINLISHAKE